MRSFVALAAAFLLAASFTPAGADEKPVKIGVLNDQNSVYSVDGGTETVMAYAFSAIKRTHTLRMAAPLSLRKSAIVL